MDDLKPAPPNGKPPPYSVLFVCLGNICRSPMAHGYFEHFLESQPSPASSSSSSSSSSSPRSLFGVIDSAGTLAYHSGDLSDPRTLDVLSKNGVAGFRHRSRKVRIEDFEAFDVILGMDSDNYDELVEFRKRAGVAAAAKKKPKPELAHVGLFGDFKGWSASAKARAAGSGEEVDDPYYGGAQGFDVAYKQMESFSKGLLAWAEAAAKAHRDAGGVRDG